MMTYMRKITACASLALSMAILLGIGTILLAGCGKTEAPGPVTAEKWPDKIVIVQLPSEYNPDTGTKHEGFRQALEEYLGIKVEEFEGVEFAVSIEAMKNKKLDIQLVSALSYYQAKQIADVEPLVTTQAMSADPYVTVFITRADRDDINSLEDLRGKTFAFVDPASASGYMYPKAHLVTELGLDPTQLESPNYFFKTVAYSGKHDTSSLGVVMGDYDAAAVTSRLLKSMAEAGLINRDDIKIIAETEVIPEGCYVIRRDLPLSLKDKILEFYLQYDDPEYFATIYSDPDIRFIKASDADYDTTYEMIRILQIEE